MVLYNIFIFVISIFFLAISSKWLIKSLAKIAEFLGWREFVFSLFAMAFAGSLPNLFVGINSVIRGVPRLAIGEVLGGNIFDLTVAIGLAAIISKNGLTVKSRTVQGTAIFTLLVALLPLILIYDSLLSRIDGLILIFTFIAYLSWLFSKEERFTRVYDEKDKIVGLKDVLESFVTLIGVFVLLFLAAKGVVQTTIYFAELLNLSLISIGLLVVGVSNALPETFFSIQAAKKGDDWMVVGALMGAVISITTLTLGIVAILSPIQLVDYDFSLLVVARIFLIIAAVSFLLFIRTGNKITRKEGIYLLVVYALFVLIQIFML